MNPKVRRIPVNLILLIQSQTVSLDRVIIQLSFAVDLVQFTLILRVSEFVFEYLLVLIMYLAFIKHLFYIHSSTLAIKLFTTQPLCANIKPDFVIGVTFPGFIF